MCMCSPGQHAAQPDNAPSVPGRPDEPHHHADEEGRRDRATEATDHHGPHPSLLRPVRETLWHLPHSWTGGWYSQNACFLGIPAETTCMYMCTPTTCMYMCTPLHACTCVPQLHACTCVPHYMHVHVHVCTAPHQYKHLITCTCNYCMRVGNVIGRR